jgi:beta-lactamase superfamily II metal-dependent hydrolase
MYDGVTRDADVLRVLAWGDRLTLEEVTPKHLIVTTRVFGARRDGSVEWQTQTGFIRRGGRAADTILGPRDHEVLRVDFVDVQQGDAALIETPKEKVVLIDGGENQLFARYLASRYPGTSKSEPLEVDAIVVSHGDADHFSGLAQIRKSEDYPGAPQKHLFIRPLRVYHNGLVKRPSRGDDGKARADVALLGETFADGKDRFLTDLVGNLLRDVAKADRVKRMNAPFREWVTALEEYESRPGQPAIDFRRLARGDDAAFDFLVPEKIHVEVLGPAVEQRTPPGAPAAVPVLRFLHEALSRRNPEPDPRDRPTSASHTINGHSVVLRLTYDRCRILFAGDLNEESERDQLDFDDGAGGGRLEAEVLKVPHHGSGDFDEKFVARVRPVVSVVSSGDENRAKEYIHPRATLVGSLGRGSRIDRPLIFITELAAFFQVEGFVGPEYHAMTAEGLAGRDATRRVVDTPRRGRFYAFSRAIFGTVRVRTDGKTILVYTDSANIDTKEAYVVDLTKDPLVVDEPDTV